MANSVHYLDQVTIVLYRPRFPENIGAVARVARNMGISRLSMVDPENVDLSRMLKMATRAAADLIDKHLVLHPRVDPDPEVLRVLVAEDQPGVIAVGVQRGRAGEVDVLVGGPVRCVQQGRTYVAPLRLRGCDGRGSLLRAARPREGLLANAPAVQA